MDLRSPLIAMPAMQIGGWGGPARKWSIVARHMLRGVTRARARPRNRRGSIVMTATSIGGVRGRATRLNIAAGRRARRAKKTRAPRPSLRRPRRRGLLRRSSRSLATSWTSCTRPSACQGRVALSQTPFTTARDAVPAYQAARALLGGQPRVLATSRNIAPCPCRPLAPLRGHPAAPTRRSCRRHFGASLRPCVRKPASAGRKATRRSSARACAEEAQTQRRGWRQQRARSHLQGSPRASRPPSPPPRRPTALKTAAATTTMTTESLYVASRWRLQLPQPAST